MILLGEVKKTTIWKKKKVLLFYFLKDPALKYICAIFHKAISLMFMPPDFGQLWCLWLEYSFLSADQENSSCLQISA